MEIPQRQQWTVERAKRGLRALAAFLLFVCLVTPPIASDAQAAPRDYSISPPPARYSPDGASVTVSFAVTNQGGDAREASQIVIIEHQSGRVEFTETLPPLAAGQTKDFAIQLPMADYPEGDLFFRIEAGIDEFELPESLIARDNIQLFRISKAEARAAAGGALRSTTSPPEPRFDLFIPLANLGVKFLDDGIQLNDARVSGDDLLGALGVLAVALLCLWLLSLILRLIFRRPPRFDPWQPPYAINQWHDPNSALGRRQSWQYHAQSSRLPAPTAPNQATVVKRLLDHRGVVLGGWRVKAIRSEQYDVYGRINKTETVMPRKLVNQLNRLARRAPNLTEEELGKAIAPIARGLSKRALAPIESQNLLLPIALDIRFEGATDEIVIQFELYQYRAEAWQLLDQWQPELGPIGELVPEHFSFTLNGQRAGESGKAFRRRLRDDLADLLTGLVARQEAGDHSAPPVEPEGAIDEQRERAAVDDETNPLSPSNR